MKKVVILPMDNVSNIGAFIEKMKEIISIPGAKELISHIKINDACHMYGGGIALFDQLISFLNEHGMQDVKIFLDLKLADTVGTIKNYLHHYESFSEWIGIVTVSTACSVEGIRAVSEIFPNAEVALVSLLTDISEEECRRRWNCSSFGKILQDILGIIGWCESKYPDAPLPFDAVVCSPLEVEELKEHLAKYSIQFIVPGIRDEWMINDGDAGQQQRYLGVREALEKGADWVVMGAQITQGNSLKNITAEESTKKTDEKILGYFRDRMCQE